MFAEKLPVERGKSSEKKRNKMFAKFTDKNKLGYEEVKLFCTI